jgi:hypothetical protein
MKVAYVFITPRAATYKLGQMILPQLEAGTHGVEVVGMFFFDDNAFVLRQGDPIGERLAKLAKEKGILLMMCDACALERNLAKGELRWCNPDGTGRARRQARLCPTTPSRACRWAASPTCMPRWRATRPTKSSRCSAGGGRATRVGDALTPSPSPTAWERGALEC